MPEQTCAKESLENNQKTQKMRTFPKTRQGLLELIAKQLSCFDTVYVSFCAELEAFQNEIK